MTRDEFTALIHDEIGLAVATDELDRELDQVTGWDSVHLLTLLTALEQATGRSISLPDVLSAPSLGRIYAVVAGGA
ncbi:acyl carrier protein [Kutzneria buriramensis]|uniref:Phosphopantetheine binding protein n=1 Tax=Kutzneria buriramensis TaxID=1045776 RepID=A0A3E0GTR6_9PSEU|nr:phosphopantetheine-binding protein [Kutzneria buriramensis]REH27632.1 phosphopantetheine binding protein [Kutzneria buriramensis]